MGYAENVQDFLAQKNIAIVGYSRRGNNPGNHIFSKLQEVGINALIIHPQAGEIEDSTPCFPNLTSAPQPISGVILTATPDVGVAVVRECISLGIPRIWLHRSFGAGSVSAEAVQLARQNDMTVIEGGCPMMFCEPVDVFHKCMLWLLKKSGGVPGG